MDTPLHTCFFVSPLQKYDFEAKQIWLSPSYSNFILPKVLLSNNSNEVQQGSSSLAPPVDKKPPHLLSAL